jgi:hypothetical protein
VARPLPPCFAVPHGAGMAATTSTMTSEEIARAHAVAAKARCDFRTAIRALRDGPGVIRTRVVREAVAAAIREVP